MLITSNGGINLFIGLHPQSDGYTPGVPELAKLTGLQGWDSFDYPLIATAVERHVGREMKDSEVSRWFARQALSRAAEDPRAVLRSLGRKLLLFWGPTEVTNTDVIEYERRASPTLRRSLSFATILALGLLGAGLSVVSLRHALGTRLQPPAHPDPDVAILLVVFVVTYAATYAPFFVASRFRVPVIPVVIIFAGYALHALWRLAVGRHWRQLAALMLAFGALRIAAGTEWVPYEPDGAMWHWRRGLLYEQEGRSGPALEELRAAVAARPDHAEAQLSLAEALAAAGDLEGAIRHYEVHLRLDPLSVDGSDNLALAYARSGDLDAAIRQWERTLELAPSDAAALNNLAAALLTHPDPGRRDPSRAVTLAERAVAVTAQRDIKALRTLAAAYRADGREAEARAVADLVGNVP